jgi:hypothetical protein
MVLQNFCIWLNEQYGRPPLAFAALVDWESQEISHQAFN